jgi:hypothetical protein
MNVVKPLNERMKIKEKQLNEEILKINNTKIKTPNPRLHLKQFDNFVSSSSAKRRNVIDDLNIRNASFDYIRIVLKLQNLQQVSYLNLVYRQRLKKILVYIKM